MAYGSFSYLFLQAQTLGMWISQLHSTITMLARVSSKFMNACLQESLDASVYHSAITIVGERITTIVDELVSLTSLDQKTFADSTLSLRQKTFACAVDSALLAMKAKDSLADSVRIASAKKHEVILKRTLDKRRKMLSDSTALGSRSVYTSVDSESSGL